MITVRITNPQEAVRRNKGWLVAKLGGLFANLEDRVESEVVERIRAALAEAGVDAVVERVANPESQERSH
jgi:hypothetical protein